MKSTCMHELVPHNACSVNVIDAHWIHIEFALDSSVTGMQIQCGQAFSDTVDWSSILPNIEIPTMLQPKNTVV